MHASSSSYDMHVSSSSYDMHVSSSSYDMLLLPLTADAGFQLPPIDMKDTTRCEFKNSAMGQSNAAKDKLYDLRQVVN